MRILKYTLGGLLIGFVIIAGLTAFNLHMRNVAMWYIRTGVTIPTPTRIEMGLAHFWLNFWWVTSPFILAFWSLAGFLVGLLRQPRASAAGAR